MKERAEIGETKKDQIKFGKKERVCEICCVGDREIAQREPATEDTNCVTAPGMMKGGHGDEVVIKKCEILTSELSVVSWGIYLWRAGKERRREGWSEQEGSLLTVRSIDFSLLLYLIAQALTQGDLGFLSFCLCVYVRARVCLRALYTRRHAIIYSARNVLKMTRLQTLWARVHVQDAALTAVPKGSPFLKGGEKAIITTGPSGICY